MKPTQTIRTLSAEQQKLVREFHQHSGIVNFWKRDSRALALIDGLRRSGEPAAISELMPFGVSDRPDVRDAARAAIQQLFSGITLERLPSLDLALRPSWPYAPPWDPGPLGERQSWNTDPDRLYLALLTSHRSGFTRAAALRVLGESEPSPALVPFIILRLSDWVDAVRRVAEEVLTDQILRPLYADALVECLGLVARYSHHGRFRPETLQRMETFLKTGDCAAQLEQGLTHRDWRVRRRCFPLALENPSLIQEEVLVVATADRDAIIRKWAYKVDPQRLSLARTDPYPPIRRMAFEAAVSDGKLAALEPFLLDRSPAIRWECQELFAKRFSVSPAGVYRTKLPTLKPRDVHIALIGLSETGTAELDQGLIGGFLKASSAKIRRSVLVALRRFAANPSKEILLNVVSTDVPSVARIAAQTLFGERLATSASIWNAARRNSNPTVRATVLKVFPNESKWTRLRLCLDAAACPERVVSEQAIRMLSDWEVRFNSSFAQPTVSDRESIPGLLEQARAQLPPTLSAALSRSLAIALRQV